MKNSLDNNTNTQTFSGHSGIGGECIPYTIWVVGEFGVTHYSTAQLHNVNLQNLNDIMRQMEIVLPVTLDRLLPQSDTRSTIKLTFQSISDFEPYRLASRIEVFSALLQCYQAIKNRLAAKISQLRLEEILSNFISDPLAGMSARRILQGVEEQELRTETPKKSADDEDIDRLFSMLDLGDTQSKMAQPQNNIAEQVGHVSDLSSAQQALLQTGLNELVRPLFKHLNAILHHDGFQKLEQSWRGLMRLLEGIEDTDLIEIAIINTDKQNLVPIYQDILSRINDDRLPAVLICDFSLDCTPADLHMLDELGQVGQLYQIPAVMNVSNQFLGVHRASELTNNTGLASLFSQAQYVKWNSLRNKEHARWLICCFNRFLLRPNYTRHNNRQLEFNEWLETDDYLLMGNASWLVAKLIVSSLREYQWPSELTPPTSSKIGGFPLHRMDLSTQTSAQTPLETLVDERLQTSLSIHGIASLQAKPDSNLVYFQNLSMLYKPGKYDNPALDLTQQTRNSLSHVLLSARIALLMSLQLDLSLSGLGVTETRQRLQHYLQALTASSGDSARVNIGIDHDPIHPGQHILKLKLQMGEKIMNGVEIDLQMPL